MIAIRNLWKFLKMIGKTDVDPELIPIPKHHSKPFVAITKQEYRDMMDSIKMNSLIAVRNRAIITLLFSTGVRVSELVALNLSDIHLNERYAVIQSKKNGKRRIVMWDEEAEEHLANYVGHRMRIDDRDHLFVALHANGDYDRLHVRTVQRLVRQLRNKAGIHKKITPHSFRHGFGMDCVRNRVHPRMMQLMLGHENITSTQVYMQVYNPDLMRAYAKFAEDRKKNPYRNPPHLGHMHEDPNRAMDFENGDTSWAYL